MDKRKLLRVGGLVILAAAVFACIVFGAYKIASNHDKKTTSNSKQSVKQTSKEEITKAETRESDFTAVIHTYNSKDYSKTITLVKSFVKQANNSDTSKLNAYQLCIQAAAQIKDEVSKKQCFDDGTNLANKQVRAAAKTGWLTSLNDAYNGTTK